MPPPPPDGRGGRAIPPELDGGRGVEGGGVAPPLLGRSRWGASARSRSPELEVVLRRRPARTVRFSPLPELLCVRKN
ncbi:MAG: hypothetical protein J5I90_00230 [Caldilineales bacterium]|nr:hypothetical protein [Caldilineales bacterium]